MISKSLQVPNGAQDMIADDGSDVESDGSYLFIYHSLIFVCLKFEMYVCHSLNWVKSSNNLLHYVCIFILFNFVYNHLSALTLYHVYLIC